MDIGFKIKNARIKAEFTQEQAAEALGVSRQTVSNWENEKTYPDIISVVKMSDLYTVSLDELLKGKAPVPSYLHYLEERKMLSVTQLWLFILFFLLPPLLLPYLSERMIITENGNGFQHFYSALCICLRGLPHLMQPIRLHFIKSICLNL